MVDLYVSTSPQETSKLISQTIINNSISGEVVDEYVISPDGKATVIVQIYEKYFLRVENRATLTVVIDDASGQTHIHALASGGGRVALFSGDYGAGEKFEESIYDAIYKYIVK